jgi:hypothetical protein
VRWGTEQTIKKLSVHAWASRIVLPRVIPCRTLFVENQLPYFFLARWRLLEIFWRQNYFRAIRRSLRHLKRQFARVESASDRV